MSDNNREIKLTPANLLQSYLSMSSPVDFLVSLDWTEPPFMELWTDEDVAIFKNALVNLSPALEIISEKSKLI